MNKKPDPDQLFVKLPSAEVDSYEAASEEKIKEALADGKAERDAAALDAAPGAAPSNILFR